MPSIRHEARKLCEMNTSPWSHTMVSGTITGRAAACASRWSRLSIRRCGNTECDIASACGQPGRIGSGVTVRASSNDASTDFVVGRSTAAVTVRVARSIMPVISTRPGTPRSSRTSTSSGVESICINCPGRAACTCPNGPSGRLAIDWRVRADPVVCRPWVSRSNRR
jgi:hypothetical protein